MAAAGVDTNNQTISDGLTQQQQEQKQQQQQQQPPQGGDEPFVYEPWPTDEGTVTVKTMDDIEYTRPKKHVFLCRIIRDLFDPENEGETIPIEVKSDLWGKILEFLEMIERTQFSPIQAVQMFDRCQDKQNNDYGKELHMGIDDDDEENLVGPQTSKYIRTMSFDEHKPWYDQIEHEEFHQFFDFLSYGMIGRLLLNANALRIGELFHGVCLKIAKLHNGLPAEETRKLFFGENGLGSQIEADNDDDGDNDEANDNQKHATDGVTNDDATDL